MDGLIIFMLIAGVVIALIVWGVQSAKKVRENWAQFAVQNGLQYSGGISASAQPHISGWYGPTHVTINTVTRGSGKNRHTYTQFHAHVNVPLPQGLNLSRQGFFSKVGQFFGGQDVQVGDKALDDAFVIKAHDVAGTVRLMRIPQVKQALLTFLARHPGMQLNERHLLFEESGICSDMARMKASIDDLAYLAQTLEAGQSEASGAPARQPTGQPRTRSQGTLRPTQTRTRSQGALRPAAAAEVLGGGIQRPSREVPHPVDYDPVLESARGERTQRLAQAPVDQVVTQQAARAGDKPVATSADRRTPAEQNAVSQVADMMHKLEEKMQQASAFRAEDVAKQSAFAVGAGLSGSAFAQSGSNVLGASEPAAQAFQSNPSRFEPPKFEKPKFESKFAPRTELPPAHSPLTTSNFGAFDTGKPASKPASGAEAISFDELVAKLSDGSLFSSDRERILAGYKNRAFLFTVEVERVERSFGFDLADNLRDGRTIEGHVRDKQIRVAARYPASENERLDRLQTGAIIEVQGCVAGWDDLFKKATLDSF